MALKINTKHGRLSITEHDSNGKLEGFHSLNTSVSNNSFCQKMRNSGADRDWETVFRVLC